MTIYDKIFEFAYGCAMSDAVQRNAYPHYYHWETDDGKRKRVADPYTEKNKLVKAYPATLEKMRAFTDGVLGSYSFSDKAEYDQLFIRTAREIRQLMVKNGIPEFTFGNVQKLMNMTLKHMYTCLYINPDLQDRFCYCHCPIDSQIASRLIQIELQYTGEEDERFHKDTKKLKSKKSLHEIADPARRDLCTFIFGISTSSPGRAWSNLDSEEDIQAYLAIQDHIRAIISQNPGQYGAHPLEFDYFEWFA